MTGFPEPQGLTTEEYEHDRITLGGIKRLEQSIDNLGEHIQALTAAMERIAKEGE